MRGLPDPQAPSWLPRERQQVPRPVADFTENAEEPQKQGHRRTAPLLRFSACLALVTFLSACAGVPRSVGVETDAGKRSAGVACEEICELLGAGRYVQAQPLTNHALKLAPRRALLNFYNALAYEKGAASPESADLASTGYALALNVDPAFWPAAFQQGVLAMDGGAPLQAAEHFGRAAQLAPDRPEPLLGFAAAAYQAALPELAFHAYVRAARLGIPQTAPAQRIAAVVSAAGGRHEAARRHVEILRGNPLVTPREVEYTLDRVEFWRTAPTPMVAVADPLPALKLGGQELKGEDKGQDDDNKGKGPTTARRRMAMVQAIIVRREETVSNRLGMNLLEGLSLAFSGTLYNPTKTWTEGADPRVKTGTQALSVTVPAVTYVLNIVNAAEGQSRIEARPALLVFDREEAKIFVGAELIYVTEGTTSGSSGTKDVGLGLQVTPAFIDDDTLNLKVTARLDSFNDASASGTFKQSVQTTKTSTEVVATLGFGETILISGGTSTKGQDTASGVPGLRSVPLLGRLFNVTQDTRTEVSVLVLLTVLRPPLAEDVRATFERMLGRLRPIERWLRDAVDPLPSAALQSERPQKAEPAVDPRRAFRREDVRLLSTPRPGHRPEALLDVDALVTAARELSF